MRLLKRERSGWRSSAYKFSLTEHVPANTPLYAILSHRWGADEVTFSDIVNCTAQTKSGYEKLDFCATQAARDGLAYFWVDTCCIDKNSSAELSEAINSMFKWYQNATKCYVYLPDVHDGQEWESAFQHSEWFNRGWTLQELIAPAVVEFYSSGGVKLGDKRSLQHQIHQITGISIDALQGKSLDQIDRNEKFSWTTTRKTTIEEDMVYCLLGIFNIHMSLIYGEGYQNALARLQRKVDRSSGTVSTVAKNAPWIVPFERNPNFTGREAQLVELERKLFTDQQTSRIAITGLGGVGKTQLVLELLHRVKEKHKGCTIMWIPVVTIETLQQGYLTVAQQLGVSGYDDNGGKADVKKLVQNHLSNKSMGQWLLVFDNADDIALWTMVPAVEHEEPNTTASGSTNTQDRLIDYLPRSRQGCIIFTTRDRKAAVTLAQQNIITVSEMSETAATQLLRKSLTNQGLVDIPQDVTVLLAELTYLPLAIAQAAAYINANGIKLADYISLLTEKGSDTIEILSEEFEDRGRYQNARNPVATTWLISFEQIRRSDPLAAEYLSFIACISSRHVPQALLPPGASKKKELDAIGTLAAYSFISRQSANNLLDMHRLVHLTTRNWLRKESLLQQWTEKAMIHLAEVFPSSGHSNRTKWRMYLPHACQILASDLIDRAGKQRMVLMRRCAKCLISEGRWMEAEVMLTELRDIYEDMQQNDVSFDKEQMMSILSRLARTYEEQDRMKEAEELRIEVLTWCKTDLGADHPSTLTYMSNLATTFAKQGRWEDAEALLVEAIEMGKVKLRADSSAFLTMMGNMAVIVGKQKRPEEAEQLNKQVIEMRRKTLEADHVDILQSMANLTMISVQKGQLQEAVDLGVQLVEKATQLLGAEHPKTLLAMNNLASFYRRRDQWKEAEQLEIRVLAARKDKLGPDHRATLDSMNNLAYTLKDLGRKDEAIRLMEDCLRRRNRVLGATHPDSESSARALRHWGAEISTEVPDTVTR